MSSTNTAPRTALTPQVAAEGTLSPAAISFDRIERMAGAMAKSGLFGIKTPEQALALMLISQAEGRHPALAAQEYHIIQGRPALKADTLLARFQQAGGTVKWNELTDKRVSATFSHPSSGQVTIDWTMDMAKSAGLAGKDNWKAYPRAMLRARVVSEGVRTCFPGVAVGVYTPEEILDGSPEVNITPVSQEAAVQQVTEAAANALTDNEREDHLIAIREAGDMESLARIFAAAWTHAKQAHDKHAADTFKAAYEAAKERIGGATVEG